MDAIEVLEDKVMAMEFAFMALAKALHQRSALPMPVLRGHLAKAAQQLREGNDPDQPDADLRGVAEHLAQLHASLGQLR